MSSPTITLQQLRYFLAAVEHGSLSAAAEANLVAQPSLSEQIRRLEQQLGVALFVRTNRRLILTEAARLLVPHAQHTLVAAELAAAAVDPIRTMTGGTVGFGTFSTAHHLIHRDLARSFHDQFPLIHLRLVSDNSTQIAHAVRDGELEAGLVSLPVDDRGLDVGPLEWSSETVYLTADAGRVSEPVPIEQLATAKLILPDARWSEVDPVRQRLTERAQRLGLSLRPAIEVDSPQVLLDLVRLGVGDTVLTWAVAHALGFLDTLRWSPLSPRLHETFAFVTRRHAELSPGSAALIQLARALLAKLPAPPNR